MRLRSLTPVFLSLAVLTSCAADVTTDSPLVSNEATTALSSIAATPALQALVNGLEDDGYFIAIRNEQTRPQPIFPGTAYYVLTINEQPVQVYEYIDNESAQNDANLISMDGASINGQPVQWVGQPHFYHKDNVTALYLGNNPAIQEALQEQLGAQFAGSTSDLPDEESEIEL